MNTEKVAGKLVENVDPEQTAKTSRKRAVIIEDNSDGDSENEAPPKKKVKSPSKPLKKPKVKVPVKPVALEYDAQAVVQKSGERRVVKLKHGQPGCYLLYNNIGIFQFDEAILSNAVRFVVYVDHTEINAIMWCSKT